MADLVTRRHLESLRYVCLPEILALHFQGIVSFILLIFVQYKLFYNILYDFLLVLLGRQLSFVVQDLVAPMLSSFSAHPSKRFVTFMCSSSSVQFWQEELGYEMKDHM